ncbi:MAG: YdeI/OmpD-associated family protein [Polyangiaceae bacterium]
MAEKKKDLETITFATPAALQRWLTTHHEKSPGIWLKIAKKDSGVLSVTYAEALDVALAFGWIDGQKASFDASYFLQRFTPRRAKSKWSQINCAKAAALIASGKMRPAGLKEVEAAKKDGRWVAAYAGQKTSTVPDDLRRALAKNRKAAAFFEEISSANRYAILYRLHHTTKPELRAAKIEKFTKMLAAGETFHPHKK